MLILEGGDAQANNKQKSALICKQQQINIHPSQSKHQHIT